MAAIPYSPTPDTQLSPGGAPTVRQTPVSQPFANPSAFGERTSEAVAGFGQRVEQVGDFFSKVAADDAANKYQAGVNKILYGDPEKKGPDGQQDTGYLGLKGDHALRARPDVDRQMNDLRTQLKSGLYGKADLQFDDMSRRYKAITDAQVGNHARTQANVFAANVNTASAKLALDDIARNADNPEMAAHAEANLVSAYVKNAELAGGGPELTKEAYAHARRDALTTRTDVIAITDPGKAMRMLEANKGIVGAKFDDFANKYRARAEQQNGRETADSVLSGAAPPAGDDAKAVLRQFEGFREKPYRDSDGRLRVGYGSDTVTKADGSVVTVGPETTVTKEDAERDLERRAAVSQKAVRQKVGADAFDALSPQAKASLTSIAYNYGEGNIPQTVVDAAKTGDPAKIAQSIRGLAGHNNGINAGRRASEANNVSQGGPSADVLPRNQADVIAEIQAKGLPPQAEAAAIARVNHSYALQNAAETKRKAEFKQKVDDSTAEALNTGVTSNPLTEMDFTKHYGPADGMAKYADYQSNLIYSADRKSVDTMSDVEQQQFLNSRTPQPGAPGYGHAMNRQAQLEKDVAQIQKTRREDPAGAVLKNPAVQGAMGQFDPKNPASFRPVADARLAAQEQLGIDLEFRSPLTKAEALKLGAPLLQILPGDTKGAKEALTTLTDNLQKMLGPQADEAFAYVIRAHRVDAEVGQQAATIFRKLRDGVPLIPQTVAPLDDAKEQAAANKALTGYGDYGFDTVGAMNQTRPFSIEPTTYGAPRNVPPAAIEFLLKNPNSDAAFDKKYGAGRAKALREKFPVAPGLP